ncbi:hypothetical protein [Pseudomonas sp. FYR_7]|uniref:hypothetical protein n=1 Tax=Pseudomonas sp. FYR_7 TaxID=3367174 RepID=UPI00370C8649
MSVQFAEPNLLRAAIAAGDSSEAYRMLVAFVASVEEDVTNDLMDLVEQAMSNCFHESQILDFDSSWGEKFRKSIHKERYHSLITEYNGLKFSDSTRNVIVGTDGYLYLSGGRHSVLDYITGRKNPDSHSFDNFRDNIKRRAEYCSARNIKYTHIIFPDKQSVEIENFPLDKYSCLGDAYSKYCIDLPQSLLYPRLELGSGSFHKKDTHMSDRGYCVLTSLLLKQLGFSSKVCEEVKQELLSCLTKPVKYSGDLGSKMVPEEFDVKLDIDAGWNYKHLKNNLGVSNDGLSELYFNEAALTQMRVLIFGDSFSRLHSLFLSKCFKEVVFLRTRYFHEELVEMAKPDLVITGNAERYLSFVEKDEMAPNFFLYPLLKGIGHAPDQEYAVAMNAFLSYGKPAYRKFKDEIIRYGF